MSDRLLVFPMPSSPTTEADSGPRIEFCPLFLTVFSKCISMSRRVERSAASILRDHDEPDLPSGVGLNSCLPLLGGLGPALID